MPDIITSTLAEQNLTDIRGEICFEHQPREYCVQASETNLDFIARLAADEGQLYLRTPHRRPPRTHRPRWRAGHYQQAMPLSACSMGWRSFNWKTGRP
ncbi:contractile injection system protein, VgrG/Pvc8 family [Pseudomonas reactans]